MVAHKKDINLTIVNKDRDNLGTIYTEAVDHTLIIKKLLKTALRNCHAV